jgi:uncharacterized RmlC-like cupin family protein
MKALLTCASFLLLSSFAMTQTEAVPVDQEPDHHLVVDNKYSRVFKVEVPPRKQTLLHEHKDDYVFITIGDSDIENVPQDKDPIRMQLKDGEIRYVKGPLTHVAKNLATTPFRNVTITVPKPGDAGGTFTGLQKEAGVQRKLIRNVKVDILDITMDPAASVKEDYHYPCLLVALNDLDLTTSQNENIKLPRGDVKWYFTGFPHTTKNNSAKPARFVVVQYK